MRAQEEQEKMKKVTETMKPSYPPRSLKSLTNMFYTVLYHLSEQAIKLNLEIITFYLFGTFSQIAYQVVEQTSSQQSSR